MTFEDNPGFVILLFIAVVVSIGVGLLMLRRWDIFRRLKMALADLQLSSSVIRHLSNTYVDHECYNTIPHPEFMEGEETVGESVGVLSAFLLDEYSEKHLFVLGDPGVGKTAVLVKFMEENLQKRGFNQLDVYAVGMDVPEAYRRIAAVPHKQEKVILIDAYQEEEVLDNHRKRRLIYLLEHCREFKKVVIFCRYDVVEMGLGHDPEVRHRMVVRNPMLAKDYNFEIIRLQSIPSILPKYVSRHYSGYGNRKERDTYLEYLSGAGPQMRYGFTLPYIPLLTENNVSIRRPIDVLEPTIRLQILTFLEEVTPGDAEETRGFIMDDAPGIWNLMAWVCEEAFKTFQVRRKEFNEVNDVNSLDAYLNAVGSDYLTREELDEIEERLDMNDLQRVAVRHILFRTEKRKYGWLRAARRPKNLEKDNQEEKLTLRRLNVGQETFMFVNRSAMEFFFILQVIDRIGGLSKLPLTFHMQELLLELIGIRDRLGERMELINGITTEELVDKYANALDAKESDNPNIARFILSNIKQVDVAKYDLSHFMLTRAILRGANMEETVLEGARLDGADLQAANLKKAVLKGANLSHARLDGAVLEEAQGSGLYLHEASVRYARMDYAFLSGSWLTGADFSHSVLASGDLEAVHVQPGNAKPLLFFETDLRWANMRYAVLPGASFEQAKLNSADFEQAHLEKASFKHATLVESNLTLCDLQHADFHAAILEGAHLKRAKLYGANFSEAHLRGTNFEHAILHNISFCGVDNSNRLDMREALLEHANMREAEIKFTELKGAQLNFSNMRRIKIQHANLAGASMKKALMDGAYFSNVDLKGANLEQATLNNATFEDAITLDEAVLTGASLLNANLEGRKTTLRKAQLQQAYLYGANLSKVFLLDADMTGCNLERAKLINARLVGAKLIRAKLFHSRMNHVELMHANMRYAILCLANLEDAKMSEADMTGVDLRDARLLRASMSRVKLDYADCKGALFDKAILEEASLMGSDMQNCVMKGAKLYGASLENANFEGVDLRNADLSHANLKGASFMNANLEGANLSDVIVDNTTNFTGANLNGVINFTRSVEKYDQINPRGFI